MKWNATVEEQRARTWRGSKISPFAGNFAFILYKCGDDYSVSALHLAFLFLCVNSFR